MNFYLYPNILQSQDVLLLNRYILSILFDQTNTDSHIYLELDYLWFLPIQNRNAYPSRDLHMDISTRLFLYNLSKLQMVSKDFFHNSILYTIQGV